MTDSSSSPSADANSPAPQRVVSGSTLMPTRAIGWLGIVLTLAGVAALATIMVMAGIANDPSAVNRNFMIAAIAMLVAGAVASVLCVTLWKQRSGLNVLAVAVSVSAVGLVTLLALAGFFNGVL